MIKSSAGRLSNEGSADSNDITDDTNNFSTEMTQKHSNRKCRRNRIQRLTNNEERRWTSAAKNLSHHRSYQNPHSRATQTAVERVRNFHSAARLIAQNFTNFTTSQHTSGQPHSFTHSVPIAKNFIIFLHTSGHPGPWTQSTTTIKTPINWTAINSFTKQLQFLSDSPTSRNRTRGTWGIFRSFVFPNVYPQLRVHPRSIAKSLRFECYCKKVSQLPNDQVSGPPMLLNLFNDKRSRTSKVQHSLLQVWHISSQFAHSEQKKKTDNDDNGRQPEVPGARPGTTKEK